MLPDELSIFRGTAITAVLLVLNRGDLVVALLLRGKVLVLKLAKVVQEFSLDSIRLDLLQDVLSLILLFDQVLEVLLVEEVINVI